jgi:putative DNA primase/helicase
MISHHEAIESFKNAMFDNIGYAPDSIIDDGELHRVKDTHGKLNGAYVYHADDRPAGYFECFKQGIKQNWKMSGAFVPLSQLQKQMQKAKHQQQEIERQQAEIAKHRESATKALYIWNHAPPAPANYPYSVKKHISIHGARLGRGNTLIIPLTNSKNEIVNLQFISETGGKMFLAGGQKKGCFYILAGNSVKIVICEGFATGASLFESSGFMTVVAFDAGNLKEVATNIRALYPKSEIVIAGDNDLSGVGQKKAIEAALAINGKYIIPATPGHDWNDSLTMEVQNA